MRKLTLFSVIAVLLYGAVRLAVLAEHSWAQQTEDSVLRGNVDYVPGFVGFLAALAAGGLMIAVTWIIFRSKLLRRPGWWSRVWD